MKLIRAFGLAIGGVLAVYLVGRGIAEFFTVNYSDPASYRLDWGGPSLAGAAVWLRRHRRRTHRLSSAA